jgi:hypothetical protein
VQIHSILFLASPALGLLEIVAGGYQGPIRTINTRAFTSKKDKSDLPDSGYINDEFPMSRCGNTRKIGEIVGNELQVNNKEINDVIAMSVREG